MVQILKAKALFDCNGDEESELTFLEGDILTNVCETSEDGWLHGRLERTGEEGLFPDNYVELIHVKITPTPPEEAGPPQLPARSSPTPTLVTSSDGLHNIPPKNTASIPILPARQPQIAVAGIRNIQGSASIPSQGLSKSGVASLPSKTALPGLGSQSMYGTVTQDLASTSDQGRPMPRPPALPRRSNTLHESSTAAEQSPTPGPALSVRERMANLSMASHRGVDSPVQTAESLPIQLPPRPASKESTQRNTPSLVTPSPFSSIARPALPPRSLTGTPVGSPSQKSSGADEPKKHSYQVPDATVPVPKLTTFARPRSARTAKGSSLTEEKDELAAKDTKSSSDPPKLPTRNGSAISTNTTASIKKDSADISGPVRFSPVAVRHNAVELSALPAISRNSQPLPLPSRANITPTALTSPTVKASQGLSRSATIGAVSAAHSSNAFDITNGPVGAAFGVKLNSVGFKTAMDTTNTLEHSVPATTTTLPDVQAAAPPLPARSNTIASTPSRFTEESGKAPTAFRREASSQPFPTSSTKMGPIQRDLQMQVSPSQTSQIHQLKLQPLAYASPRMDSIGGWEGRTAPKNAPGSRVAIPPARLPEAGAVDTVRIKPDARRRYEALFRSLSSTEYIEGPKVHAVYVRSRLESRMLAQIWDLVDVDNAGRLSRAQFCMGLYLIDERLSSGLIPLEVSDELWVSVMQ